MALIDPSGIYDGDRISQCSPAAQLYYLRLLIGANTLARFKIDYQAIVAQMFHRWPNNAVPSQYELMGYIEEYHRNRLLFVYRVGNDLWGQWDTHKTTFGKYQNKADRRSPEPPKEEFAKWIEENRKLSSKVPVVAELPPMTADLFHSQKGNFPSSPQRSEISPHSSEILPHGVGVEEGDGNRCVVLEGEKQQPPEPEPEPLSSPTHTAQVALTEINNHGTVVPVRSDLRVATDAAESCHNQGMPFTEIAELMIRGAQLYEASHSPPNWYSYFANTLFLHPESLGRNGNGSRTSAAIERRQRNGEALIHLALGDRVSGSDVDYHGPVRDGVSPEAERQVHSDAAGPSVEGSPQRPVAVADARRAEEVHGVRAQRVQANSG